MAMKNYYNGLNASGTTLTDMKGTTNGTLQGASLPVIKSNGYLNFTGGNNNTAGNRNRVGFNRSDFQKTYTNSFSFVVLFRSTKLDATIHSLFNVYNSGIAGFIDLGIYTDETFYCYMRTSTNQTKAAFSAGSCCDGKFHVGILTYSQNSLLAYFDGKLLINSLDATQDSGNFYSSYARASLGARYKSSAGGYVFDLTGGIACSIHFEHKLSAAEDVDITNELMGVL